MMKITILCGLFACFILCSCGDKEEASPSNLNVNWFQVAHDPNADALDQVRYDIFKESGYPIFYNDTLGTQTRYNSSGEPYTYYEVFQPGYTFIALHMNVLHTLSYDREELKAMSEYLRDYLIKPYLNPIGPKGILIVDTLFLLDNQKVKNAKGVIKERAITIVALNGMAVNETGGLVHLYDMTEEMKKDFALQVSCLELEAFCKRLEPESLQAYYDITKEAPDTIINTKVQERYVVGGGHNIKQFNIDVNTPEKYGVLSFGKNNGSFIYLADKLQDLSDFAELISTKTDAEIRERYKEYPIIIKRYEALLKMLKDHGITQFIKK